MSELSHDKLQVINSFNSEDFVELTIHQINKDLFGLSQIELQQCNSGNNCLNDLIFQLSTILKNLATNNFENLTQFIYKVDLSEKIFKQSITRNNDFKDLAEHIIVREAQKVYLRKKFS